MLCLAALFILGYVNSCDSGAEANDNKPRKSQESITVVR